MSAGLWAWDSAGFRGRFMRFALDDGGMVQASD